MSIKSNVVEVADDAQFHAIVKESSLITAVNFWAAWAPQCSDMSGVFDELSRKFPILQFLKVEAEELPDISESYEIAAVPTFIIIKNGEVVDKVEGANAPQLTSIVEKHFKAASSYSKPKIATTTSTTAASNPQPSQSSSTPEQLKNRLKKLVASHPVMLFMKGTPDQPRCGFSRQVVDILAEQNVTYGSFNILADEDVRAGLKEFSNWPTFPQLYVKGELVGGLDILKEMVASGEFQAMLPPEDDLNTRLKKLVSSAPVMLFIKGVPDQPRCGFSRQIVQLLRDNKVKFESFDILGDEEVRAGLKEFSNWPTFPQRKKFFWFICV